MSSQPPNLAGVAGMGMISALGATIADTRRELYADTPRLPTPPHRIATSLNLPVFEIPGLETVPPQPGGVSLHLLRHALRAALDDARLTTATLARHRVGVCIGTTVACQLNDIPFYATLRSGATPPARPFTDYIAGNPAECLRRELALHGPALTIANACASGADAIGIALLWIRQGICDVVIAGGTDELNRVPLVGFNALGVCAPTPCRPFDADRNGLNLGEAAGILILANPAVAPAVHGAVAGYGNSADAYHITQPDPDGHGLERAIRHALADAGPAGPESIAFINAHGTGTPANDRVEATVFQRLFPDRLRFLSTKALTGHTLGAAGAIEAILTLIMLEQERVPASTRFKRQGDDMPCAPLRQAATLAAADTWALSTSLAFGGVNSALLLRRC